MSWSPTGSPSERPQGIEMPGSPAMLTGSVQASARYIATGSASRAPNGQATYGLVGATSASIPLPEDGVEVALDERPHLLRLQVVGVVVAGREGVRAEHDPPLHLGPEAAAARGEVVREHVAVAHGVPVADAVVAGEVGAGLGRGDDVVRREAVVGVGQADVDDLGAGRLEGGDGLPDPRLDARLHAGHEVLARQAEADAAQGRRRPRRRTPGGASSSGGTGRGAEVASRSSRPATAWSRSAASRASRPNGPTWSRELAKATIP